MLRLIELVAPAAVVKKALGASPGRYCVVLLGWGGSKARHLNRVREFYLSRPSVGSVVSFSMPLWAPQFVRTALVKNLMRSIDSKARVICHAFSNNGTWVYGELGLELNKEGAQIERVVIDSAPYFKYETMPLGEAVAKYQPVILSTLLNKDVYHHPVYTPILKAILYTMGLGIKSLYTIPVLGPALVPDLITLSLHLRDDTNPIPTLFVYGKEDKLIPPTETEDFAAALERRGVPTQRQLFDEAKHVSAFYDKSTREEYKKILDTFFQL